MPFCEDCAKYWAPTSMSDDGTCPTCGRVLEPPTIQPTKPVMAPTTIGGKALREMAGEEAKAPWHFKLLVVALIVYLGYRVVAMIGLV